VPEPDLASGPAYEQIAADLRTAYDGSARQRDRTEKTPWKLAERAAFLGRLRADRAVRLLEVGAGAGQDSEFFAASGLTVVATDNSPGMVACCVARGLDARVADFLTLDLAPASFDAVYAMNCLLHVPNSDLAAVLALLRLVLRPGGLLYVGLWAGDGTEGLAEDDWHTPARFFSWRTDEQLAAAVLPFFEIVGFHVRDLGADRYQSMTLRRPSAEGSDRS
jgi:SAM-dependent methyltransferase